MSKEKTRDSLKTKNSIIQAGAIKFAEKGFDGAGVREIAACAGVNQTLVARYFGSKEGLFNEAVIPYIDLGPLLEQPVDTLAQSITTMLLTKERSPDQADPMLAIMRSAGSPVVGELIRTTVEKKIVDAFIELLGEQEGRERAALIIAVMFGVDALRRIIQIDSFSDQHREKLQPLLCNLMRSLLDSKAQ